jgi:hypothetical protein
MATEDFKEYGEDWERDVMKLPKKIIIQKKHKTPGRFKITN